MESSHGEAIEEPTKAASAAESKLSANSKKRMIDETEKVEELAPTTANETDHDFQETSPPSISFVVTGFGPFGGVPENPTMMLVNGLIGYLKSGNEVDSDQEPSKQEKNDNWKLELVPRIRHCQVVETSAGAVEEALQTLYQELQRTADTESYVAPLSTPGTITSPPLTILLHLGVNWKGTAFQLEQCAYNDATFRIPDQRGFRPQQETIQVSRITKNDNGGTPEHEEEFPLGQCCKTTVDLHKLCRTLQQEQRRGHEAGKYDKHDNGESSAASETTNLERESRRRKVDEPGKGSGEEENNDDKGNGHAAIEEGNMTTATKDKDTDTRMTDTVSPSTPKRDTVMARKNPNSVIVSTNPGRFVCNYIYYCSLKGFQEQQQKHLDKFHSLFVHVPPIDVIPLKQQFQFVSDLLRELSTGRYC